MRWLLSLFTFGQPLPSLRQIPGTLLKCVVWGCLTGPLWCLFFTALFKPRNIVPFLISPSSIAAAGAVGVAFSLSFYVFCGPGNTVLRFWIENYPPALRTALYVAYNALACPLAFACAALIVTRVPNSFIQIEIPHFWRILVFESALGAAIAVIIGSFVKLRVQVERTQTEAARAQALALQSQINPHFFFNTLNTISALIDEDPAASKRMIGRLSDMFRYTLGCTHAESVTLEQELQFVRDYLDIEQARFRSRLRVELPRGPLPAMQVPGLVLQPLVENAVKHGIAHSIEGGVVSIQITTMGSTARITVRNSCGTEGLPDDLKLYRKGHALENVRARLRLFTGKPNPLQFVNAAGWTEFSFESAVSGQ